MIYWIYSVGYLIIGLIFAWILSKASWAMDYGIEENTDLDTGDDYDRSAWWIIVFPGMAFYSEFFLDLPGEQDGPLSHYTIFWGRSKWRKSCGIIFYTLFWPIKILEIIFGVFAFLICGLCELPAAIKHWRS